MKRKTNELYFISRIQTDGTGIEICQKQPRTLSKEGLDWYKLQVLSLTEKTYIASNMNTYVVKLKGDVINENTNIT